MLPRGADQPILLIVAGPNGSGKSTVYANADLEWDGRSVWIVNPDVLAATIGAVERLTLIDANLAAVQRIETWLEASISVHKTIGVETVLSTGKYRRLVEAAQRLGFAVWLIYVVLDGPARSIERIRARVAKGGHHVPDDKVVKRYAASLDQLPWFLDRADRAWLWDNSGARPRQIGEKQDGVIALDGDALPAVIDAVRSLARDRRN